METTSSYSVFPISSAEQQGALERFQSELEKMPIRRRNSDLVAVEYGTNNYGRLLAANPPSASAASRLLLQNDNVDTVGQRLVALGQRLFRGRFLEGMQWHDSMLDQVLRKTAAAADGQWFCELGCGFGPHLARLGDVAYGGEYTRTGIQLGRQLGIDVQAFDFYDHNSYAMIRPRSVVFTCAAIEQLPSADAVLEGLRSQRQNIAAVVHLEPTYLKHRQFTRLGHLQNTYIERCDYNRDLNLLLQNQPDIELLTVDYDIIGLNPLNPHSLFVWKFRM